MVTQEYYVGVDLGQKKSYTAIAVVERRTDRVEVRDPVTWAMEWKNLSPPRLLVRHLERVPLGTSYVDVVDATGAGNGVVERVAGAHETGGGRDGSGRTGSGFIAAGSGF